MSQATVCGKGSFPKGEQTQKLEEVVASCECAGGKPNRFVYVQGALECDEFVTGNWGRTG
jgi:hypothetical protein